MSVSAFAGANTSARFVNPYTGAPDTNIVILQQLRGYDPILSDGSVITMGIPVRIRPNTNGYIYTNIMQGNWMYTNASLGQGIIFAVPNDSSTNVWCVTCPKTAGGIAISGFNVFNYTPGINTATGTNGFVVGITNGNLTIDGNAFAPTSNQIITAIGFVPLSPLQVTNAITNATTNSFAAATNAAHTDATNLVTQATNTTYVTATNTAIAHSDAALLAATNVVWPSATNYADGRTKSNIVAGSNITLTTNGNRITIAASGGSSGAALAVRTLATLTVTNISLTAGGNGTDWNISPSGTNINVNLPLASATTTGRLAAVDFTNFNARVTQAQLTTATNNIFNSGTNAAKTYADTALAVGDVTTLAAATNAAKVYADAQITSATNANFANATNAAKGYTDTTLSTATNAVFNNGTNAAKLYTDAATNTTYAASTNAAKTFATNAIAIATNANWTATTNFALGFLQASNNITLTKVGTNLFIASASGSGGGITTLNGLTNGSQTFATGTNGTAFAVSSSGSTHTFNLPFATATNNGQLGTNTFTNFNARITPAQLTTATNTTFLGAVSAAYEDASSLVDAATNAVLINANSFTTNTVTNGVAFATNAARIFTTNALTNGIIFATNAAYVFTTNTVTNGVAFATNAARIFTTNALTNGIIFSTNAAYAFTTNTVTNGVAFATNAARIFATNALAVGDTNTFAAATNAAYRFATNAFVATNELRPVVLGSTLVVSNDLTARTRLFFRDGSYFTNNGSGNLRYTGGWEASFLAGLDGGTISTDGDGNMTFGANNATVTAAQGWFRSKDPVATNDLTTKAFADRTYIPLSLGTSRGDILVRDNTGWTTKSAGPNNYVIMYDDTQATGIRAGVFTAVATNAIGSYNGQGTNTKFFGTNYQIAPIRIYSGISNLAAISLIDTNNFGSEVWFSSSADPLVASGWKITSDGASNGNFAISAADGISPNPLTANRATHFVGIKKTSPEEALHVGGNAIIDTNLTVRGAIVLGGVTNSTWPSGGSVTTSNVLYVAKNGNDSTGTRGRLDLPFLTIGNAKTNSHDGDLIYVYPGTYDETGLATNSINYYFCAGATVDYTGDSPIAIFDDAGLDGGCDLSISGYGTFINESTAAAVPGVYVFHTTNSDSVVHGVLKHSGMVDAGNVAGSAGVMIENCSEFYLTGDDFFSPNGTINGLVWKNGGNIHIDIKNIVVPDDNYAVWEVADVGTDVIDMHVTAEHIDGKISGSGNNSNSALWVTSQLNEEEGASFLIYNTGLGKLYTTAQKDWARLNGYLLYSLNGKSWHTSDKLTAGINSIGFIYNIGGTMDVTVQEYKDEGITDSGVGIYNISTITNATTIVHGGRMAIVSPIPAVIHEGGIMRLEGMTIDSSLSPSNTAYVRASGLTFKDCHLICSNTVSSITATNAQTVTIDGTLTVNTDPSYNVTFSGGGTLIVTAGTNTPVSNIAAPWGSKYFKTGSTNFWFKDTASGTSGWTPR